MGLPIVVTIVFNEEKGGNGAIDDFPRPKCFCANAVAVGAGFPRTPIRVPVGFSCHPLKVSFGCNVAVSDPIRTFTRIE